MVSSNQACVLKLHKPYKLASVIDDIYMQPFRPDQYNAIY